MKTRSVPAPSIVMPASALSLLFAGAALFAGAYAFARPAQVIRVLIHTRSVVERILTVRDANTLQLSKPQTIVASWYGEPFHGKTTRCGDRYDMYHFTVAHRTLPCGTDVLIRNPKNGKSVLAKVTDSGPFNPAPLTEWVRNGAKGPKPLSPHPVRDYDLSFAVARELDFVKAGTAQLSVQLVMK